MAERRAGLCRVHDVWKVLAAFCGGRALSFLLVAVAAWHFERPPRAYGRVAKLKPGMLEAEVIAILGKPSSELSGGRTLAYGRPLGWGILHVYLDEEYRFDRYEYDA